MWCHLPKVYPTFQIDISKHVEEKSGKVRGTDGWTPPQHNTAVISNGYKNETEADHYLISCGGHGDT